MPSASRHPSRSADASHFGRTAICMTGFSRSLFAHFPEGVVPSLRRHSGHEALRVTLVRTAGFVHGQGMAEMNGSRTA